MYIYIYPHTAGVEDELTAGGITLKAYAGAYEDTYIALVYIA